ncbi:MAG: hypothetical protein K2W82_17100 [Candidatus Obscuribacterales bacterium]|nr:hypothetical protein [Candidatus Obscuribacterales bacterium]
MCVSLRPAHFSKTKGLTAEAKMGRKTVHLLGYQNTVANTAGDSRSSPTHRRQMTGPSRRRGGAADFGWDDAPVKVKSDDSNGNAMLLPIPAKPGTMSEDNVLDTSSAPNFLKNMETAISPRMRTLGGIRRGGRGADSMKKAIVFDHDIYTVVLASTPAQIAKALKQVPEHRRPPLNKEMFDAYAKWYKGWTFAFCCFDTVDEANAKPLLWWYEPSRPEFLFFPALDGHDGNVPNLQAEVTVDHALMVGCTSDLKLGSTVDYTDAGMSAQLRTLLPRQVLGHQYNQKLPNGDFLFRVEDVRNSEFKPSRALPPGASKKK